MYHICTDRADSGQYFKTIVITTITVFSNSESLKKFFFLIGQSYPYKYVKRVELSFTNEKSDGLPNKGLQMNCRQRFFFTHLFRDFE